MDRLQTIKIYRIDMLKNHSIPYNMIQSLSKVEANIQVVEHYYDYIWGLKDT